VIPVGLLASVIGQLISTQAVLGKRIKPAVAKPKHKTLNT
jgi:hypothetical protein